jgi:hypothetical protein
LPSFFSLKDPYSLSILHGMALRLVEPMAGS